MAGLDVGNMEALLGIAPSESSMGEGSALGQGEKRASFDGDGGDWLTSVVKGAETAWSQTASPVQSGQSEPIWQGNTLFEPKDQVEADEHQESVDSGARPQAGASAAVASGASAHVVTTSREQSSYVSRATTSAPASDSLRAELAEGMARERALAEAVSRMKGLADDRARQTERVKHDLERTAKEVNELKLIYGRRASETEEVHGIIMQSKTFLRTIASQAKEQLGGTADDVLASLEGDESGRRGSKGDGEGTNLVQTAGTVHQATTRLCLGLLDSSRSQAGAIASLQSDLERRTREAADSERHAREAEEEVAFTRAAAAAAPRTPPPAAAEDGPADRMQQEILREMRRLQELRFGGAQSGAQLEEDIFQWGETSTGAAGGPPPGVHLSEEEREVWSTMEGEIEACRASRAGLVTTLGSLQGALTEQLVTKTRECAALRERLHDVEARAARDAAAMATPRRADLGGETPESLAQENECLYMMNAMALKDNTKMSKFCGQLEMLLARVGVPASSYEHLRPVMGSAEDLVRQARGSMGMGAAATYTDTQAHHHTTQQRTQQQRSGSPYRARATPAAGGGGGSPLPSRVEGERLAGAGRSGLYQPLVEHASSVEHTTKSLGRATGDHMLSEVNTFIERALHSSSLQRSVDLADRAGEEDHQAAVGGLAAAAPGAGGGRHSNHSEAAHERTRASRLQQENTALRRLLHSSAVKSVAG